MNKDPAALLDSLLDSMVKLDLVVFLYQNPDTMDNVAGLSHWIGADDEAVRRALEALDQAGIVEAYGQGTDVVYTWTSDPEVKAAVEQFMQERYYRRDSRLRLIAEILHREETEGD